MAEHGWMVITGAGGGIMEAGHRGAGREASMGLNIMLPFEQSANEFIEGDPKLVTMKYFFTRKLMFVKECSGVVCCPGGFGTLDEALETLTLMQTGKQTMIPLVLLDHPGGSYWSDLGKFIDKNLAQGGMISPEDVRMYKITNSVDEAIAEVLDFYKTWARFSPISLNSRGSSRISALKEKWGRLILNFEDVAITSLSLNGDTPLLKPVPRGFELVLPEKGDYSLKIDFSTRVRTIPGKKFIDFRASFRTSHKNRMTIPVRNSMCR